MIKMSAAGIMTPVSLEGAQSPKKSRGINTEIKISMLTVHIKWDGNSWATQLCYGDIMLLEGRQYHTAEEAGFTQSFLWFCEEARFLCYEFTARDYAVTGPIDSAKVPSTLEDTACETRTNAHGQKDRRLLKLKFRTRH